MYSETRFICSIYKPCATATGHLYFYPGQTQYIILQIAFLSLAAHSIHQVLNVPIFFEQGLAAPLDV